MAGPLQPSSPPTDARVSVGAVGLAIALVLGLALGLPVLGVALQVLRSGGEAAVNPETQTPVFVWGSIWTTILYVSLIGCLATVLGLPGAWLFRLGRPWVIALIGVPLLMPMYLAYSGWGLLRGPGSWLGDWLGQAPPWVSLAFNRGLAVAGLSLWAWPIAALIVGVAARRIPAQLLESLDLEPASAWRKARVVLGLLAAPIGASIVLVSLVMAGSAVPLHLAQVQTYAIHLWMYMSLITDAASVWPAAFPLMLVAGIGAAWLVGRMSRRPAEVQDLGDAASRPVSPVIAVLAATVWSMSVLGPAVLFASHLKRWSSIWEMWQLHSAEAQGSLFIAGIVGAVVAGLAAGTFALRSAGRPDRPPMALRAGVWAMITAALLPGVLIGAATLAFWNAPFIPRAAGNTIWPVVCAHVCRFAFAGMIAGWWLASLETTDERGARLMLAGGGLRAWAALCLRPNLGAVVGIGLAGAALSLHEIEATVMIQRGGPQSLAQYLLDKLHFNRNEELCAACVNLLALGTALAAGSGWLIGRVASRRRVGSGSQL